MGQLLVRDLNDEVILQLERRAEANHRSAEAEHRAILEEALLPRTESRIEIARRLQNEVSGGGPDSADLIRAARDARTRQLGG
jgi:plasmid stability protein